MIKPPVQIGEKHQKALPLMPIGGAKWVQIGAKHQKALLNGLEKSARKNVQSDANRENI